MAVTKALAIKTLLAQGPRILPGDRCILNTRVVMDVLAPFALQVEPLAVQVDVYNNIAVNAIAAEYAKHEPTYKLERMPSPEGFWSVSVGPGPAVAHKWPGHLVTLVDGIELLDLTLPQANRPEKGIVTGPLFTRVTPEFLVGNKVLVLAFDVNCADRQNFLGFAKDLQEGECNDKDMCVAFYQRLDDRSYERSADWKDRRRRREFVAELAEEIRRAADKAP